VRYVIAFGRFWYGFLIGDRPELFIGPILGLTVVAALAQLGWAAAGGLLLFAFVVASGGWGIVRDLAEARAAPAPRADDSYERIESQRGGIGSGGDRSYAEIEPLRGAGGAG